MKGSKDPRIRTNSNGFIIDMAGLDTGRGRRTGLAHKANALMTGCSKAPVANIASVFVAFGRLMNYTDMCQTHGMAKICIALDISKGCPSICMSHRVKGTHQQVPRPFDRKPCLHIMPPHKSIPWPSVATDRQLFVSRPELHTRPLRPRPARLVFAMVSNKRGISAVYLKFSQIMHIYYVYIYICIMTILCGENSMNYKIYLGSSMSMSMQPYSANNYMMCWHRHFPQRPKIPTGNISPCKLGISERKEMP